VKGNLDYADKIVTQNYAGEGPRWIKNFVELLKMAFPDIQVSVNPVVAEGNMVAWQRTHTGTHQGEYMGFQPTEKKITWRAIILSKYNSEGKVIEETATSNLFEILQKNKTEEAGE
jgi:predicted ester cyclase